MSDEKTLVKITTNSEFHGIKNALSIRMTPEGGCHCCGAKEVYIEFNKSLTSVEEIAEMLEAMAKKTRELKFK